MNFIKTTIIAAAIALSPTMLKAESSVQMNDVQQFFAKNLEGKKFKTETHGELPTGAKYDFSRTLVYSNFKHNDSVLTFQISWSIRQDIFDRLADGTYSKIPTNKDRIGLTECQLAEMKSTKELSGYCLVAANSSDVAHGISNATLKLLNNKLTFTMVTSNYVDSYSNGNKFEAGRSETITNYSVGTDGKTISEESYKSWMVNPSTLELIGNVKVVPTQTVIAQ